MKNAFLAALLMMFMAATAQQTTPDRIYRTTEVDAKPNLRDGMYTLTMFISKHFQFPEIKNKKVRIFTSFIIEPDGSMKDEKAVHIDIREYLPTDVVQIKTEDEKNAEAAILEGMKSEAVRVLALFEDQWLPAVADGKPVRCLYNYPISFNIE